MSRGKAGVQKKSRLEQAFKAARSTRNLPNRDLSSQANAAYRKLGNISH